jgi:hypothetical protein
VIRADPVAPSSVKDDLLAGDDVRCRDGYAHITAIEAMKIDHSFEAIAEW